MGGLTKRISAAIKVLRGTPREDWDAYYGAGWPGTMAGTHIGEGNALTISGLFAALNFLSSTVASLPRAILRRLPSGGNERAIDHPLYDRLHNKPNSTNMTAWQWIYTSVMGKYLWGNWYTLISPNGELTPLLPGKTWRDPNDLDIYHTLAKDGRDNPIPQKYMLHIPHISLDGVEGKGIVHYARESLGLVKAQDKFAATFFGSGIHAGGFVEVEKPMDENVRQGLQTDFNEKYGGLGKMWKAIFMTGGAKFIESEIDAEKSQVLESRQFSIVEIARWTNLPPHILRDLARATFSNIEQQGIELVMYSLLPLTTQVEQAMNIALFTETERRQYFVKFDLKGLLRGDMAARTLFYNAMLDRGVFNADMVLELEDMNPQRDGLGQIYGWPLNFANKEDAISPSPLTIEAPRFMRDITRQSLQLISRRSAALRRKITIAYQKQFDAYGQRIVGEEVKRIREIITEMLSQRDSGSFLALSDKFYSEFSARIDQSAAPLLASYAEAILPIAQEEIKNETEIGPRYQQFQAQYRGSFVNRHLESSQSQLRTVVQQAQDEEQDLAGMLEQRLVEWEEKRPAKISMRESLRAENAFTRQVLVLCGITKIMSVSYGKSCPYCNDLDGKVIGIEENFLTPGDFQPEGAERPLTVTSDHSHPPYHDGCDCGIVAGM